MAGITIALMSSTAVRAVVAAGATLVYDLDAVNFAALPTIGGSILTGNNQALRPPVSSAFTYGTGNFTIEWWSNQTATNGVQGIWRNSTGDTLNAIGYWTIQQPGGRITITIGNGTTSDVILSNSVITTNTWNHFAFVRSGNLFTLYVNGVAQTQTLTSSIDLPAQLAYMQIGNAGGNFFGYVTNFRIVKGTAVYTSNFTPLTQPLSAIPGTSLLLLAGNSSNFLTDQGPFAHTITNSGSVFNSASPFSSVKDATGTYTLTSSNANTSIAWNSAGGGSWVKSNNVQADTIYGGPNYATGQSYTVFMAYKLSATSAGRILNSQDEARNWLMGSFTGRPSAFYPGFTVNLPGGSTDTVWHLDWVTWDAATNTGRVYTSTNTAPTDYAFTGTNAAGGGFIELRMFSRSGDPPTVQTGNIAFVKVYDGVLTLAEIQGLHATYRPRFDLELYLDASRSYPGSGTTWTDLSGNSRNGTLTNGPTYSSADGGSIVFDGTDDFVQCSGSVTATTATFVAWIRRNGDQGTYDSILFSRGTNVSGMMFQSSNQLAYTWNNAINTYTWNSGLTIPDLTWCMVAVSVTSTSATAYLCQSSGITSATNTVSHTSTTLDDIKLGQDDFGGRFFTGNIAIAKLYSTALSADQISVLFNADKARFGY
jgi:hypothetical protein